MIRRWVDKMKGLFQNKLCIVCHEEISFQMVWVLLFSKESNTPLCDSCSGKLNMISGDLCQICGRSFENGKYRFKQGELCFDCICWEEDQEWKGILDQNFSLFSYNDFLKETIAAFKFRGDYIIAKAFAGLVKQKLQEIKADYVVPIPLSEERLFERGFNQSEALILEAGFRSTRLLTRLHTEKQSKRSRSERIHLRQVFQMAQDGEEISGKNILIMDDIYTTGSTIRHAAKVLKSAGASNVFSLTLARG